MPELSTGAVLCLLLLPLLLPGLAVHGASHVLLGPLVHALKLLPALLLLLLLPLRLLLHEASGGNVVGVAGR